MIVSMNRFFSIAGMPELKVKPMKVQRMAFRSEDKILTTREYRKLVETAERKGNRRLSCLMQTLGATGIRISELPFITVEAAKERRAVITMKGKTRIVPLGDDLCLLLLAYAKEAGIETGSLFITRNKNPMDRSNIRREMKALSKEAGVPREKIFPHNFRHMFACAFYQKTKDAVRLADILGHASVNTTRIYTTISLSEQAREINGLGLIIRQTQKERRRKKKRKRRAKPV